MPQIDQLLESMARFGAQAALLTSGERVQLAFPTGNRYGAQTISHDALMALVEEILPDGAEPEPDGTVRFLYDAAGVPVLVQVDGGDNAWRVSVRPQRVAPAPAAAPEPPAEPEPPAAPEAYYGEVRSEGTIEKLLVEMLSLGASDLHLSTGSPPQVRVHGVMQALPGHPILDGDELLDRLNEITPARNREEFKRRNDTDFGYAIPERLAVPREPVPRPPAGRPPSFAPFRSRSARRKSWGCL